MTAGNEVYDCVVVGGGPAGLTAGIHLAWHDRRVLVLDRRTGPLFFTLEQLHNVPGMSAVRGVQIQKDLAAQARELGAELEQANVVAASGMLENFRLESEDGRHWETRTILLATGVARYHPTVDGDFRPCFKYAGKGNLYYCPDCEAPEIFEKYTIVIGTAGAAGAAGMALGLSRYTDKLRLLLTGEKELPPEWERRLASRGIGVVTGEIRELVGSKGVLRELVLSDGSALKADAFFVSSPARGRTDLAQQLGVEMAPTGHHAQPKSQRGDTNVPGVWVAGDLRPMTQQVSVATGTGNIAAVMIDQYLRKRDIGPI